MASQSILFNFSLLLIAILFLGAMHGTHAEFRYIVIDFLASPARGGDRYRQEIGNDYTAEKAFNATDFVFQIFHENTNASRKSLTHFKIFIQDRDEVAFTTNNEIHFGARYIQNFTGDVRFEFTGILYHEVTHVWQWDGNGEAPRGLIEGIADFVRLKAEYAPSTWGEPGEGNKWDEGYDVTAYFLDYCNNLKNGNFVAELNEKMRFGYSDAYFVELLGKTVDELWSDYKAQYGS